MAGAFWIPQSLTASGTGSDKTARIYFASGGPAATGKAKSSGRATPTTQSQDTFTCWPAQPITGTPPLSLTIPSYLYVQYNDDDALQAFVKAYNGLTQEFVAWFNTVSLPIYPLLSGDLLDWVAAGLYGFPERPVLGSGTLNPIGALDTYAYDTLAYNGSAVGGNLVYNPVSDDVFRRIITWHFYKGDGKVFNIRWLKRRIARFLYGGENCLNPNVLPTYTISVQFGPGNIVYIGLLLGVYKISRGAAYDSFAFNSVGYDGQLALIQSFSQAALAQTFIDCVNGGFLELPFQFQFIVAFN